MSPSAGGEGGAKSPAHPDLQPKCGNAPPGELAPAFPDRLALALIARDEEDLLPACLASVEGIVDEIVVVDTGSIDRTAEIARAAGARLLRLAWREDFAEARNAALGVVTADWILLLDADERLAPGAGAVLRASIADPDLDCGLLPLYDASRLDAGAEEILSGAARIGTPVLLPRLFRRTVDLAWEGRIHEMPKRWLAARVHRCRPLEAPILHLGAVPELQERRGKTNRNLRLLERACAEDPLDIRLRIYLSSERMMAGQVEAAWAVQEEVWRLETARREGASTQRSAMPSARLRLQLQHARGDLKGMRDTLAQLDRWVQADPDEGAARLLHPDLAWYHAVVLERHAQHAGAGRLRATLLEAARVGLDRLLQDGPAALPTPVLPGLWEQHGPLLLATVLVQLGRWEEVLALCGELCQVMPGDPRPPLLQAEALLGLGLQEAAVQVLDAAGELPHDDAAVLRAWRALAVGDPDGATRWVDSAVEHASTGFAALHRRDLLRALRATLRSVDGPAPVWVGGASRSGVGLLRAMLNGHPHLHATPEHGQLSKLLEQHDEWAERLDRQVRPGATAGPVLDEASRALRDGLWQRLEAEGLRVVESCAEETGCWENLARIYPRARFIHVLRDGRAVAASLVGRLPRAPTTGETEPGCANLGMAVRAWAEVVATTRQSGQAAPGRVLEVRYELLVLEPEATMRRVLAFLGEPWHPEVLAPGQRATTTEGNTGLPLDPGRIASWRHHLQAEDIELLDRMAGPALTLLGYD